MSVATCYVGVRTDAQARRRLSKLLAQTQAHEQEVQRHLELTRVHEQEAAQVPGLTESGE